jgi:hypothetical protein
MTITTTKVDNGRGQPSFAVVSLVALNAWLVLVALPLFRIVLHQAISPATWLAAGMSIVAAVGSFRWRNRDGMGPTLWLCLVFPLSLLTPGLLLQAHNQWPWASAAAELLCAVSLVGYLVGALLYNGRRMQHVDCTVEPLDGDNKGRPQHLVPPWSWWLGLAAALISTGAAWWHGDWGNNSAAPTDRARLATLTLASLALSQYVLWGVVAPLLRGRSRPLPRPKPFAALLWLAGACLAFGFWLALGYP